MTLKTATPAEILALPLQQPNDAEVATIADYLIKLLDLLWRHGDLFSGKRPFGNSGWEADLYLPLIQAGLVKGALDEDGHIEDMDYRAADKLIADAIQHLRPGQQELDEQAGAES